ncbi:MAG: molybdopterin cofactor-binding domain-containing protein [Rhizobiaceae bacterium]
MTVDISRRRFLQTTAAVAGGAAVLAIGINPTGAIASTAQQGDNLSPFVKIYPDGTVSAIIKHLEGGQGTATGLSALVAEEMNMSLQDITFEMAPADNKLYANLAFGAQGTGGSTSMANSFMQYRTAAAAAREMLLQAAANEWGVKPSELTLKDAVISGAGKSGNVGQFVAAAAALDVPAEPKLKSKPEWTVIGVDQAARKDTPAKINGSAKFTMDMHLENQMVVAIRRTPRLGGLVAGFDDSAARAVQGFIKAVEMPNKKGVFVFAETTWSAFQARDALQVEWDFSAAEKRSSAELKAELMTMVSSPPEFQASKTSLAMANSAIDNAAQVVERDFYFPLLAHAPMEAMGATIEPLADGQVVLHDGAQSPASGHAVLSNILELPMDKVKVNTLYAGGFFGRRSTPDADYLVELALAFAVTDRSRPVKLQWSREDDITGGYYRPAYAHKVRVGLDDEGHIVGWDHRIAGQSLFKGTPFENFIVRNGVDHTSVEGVADTPYAIPAMHVGLTDQKGPTTPNWWRSVGHSHTGFVMECMMDLCAAAAKADPVDYRLSHLSGDSADHQRMAGVIRLVAEKSGWGADMKNGHSRGLAVHKSFNTYVAEVCDISIDAADEVKIEKFWAAVDCGIAVTPDVIRAQIEGGIGYGVGHVMRAELTLEEGVVSQSNFHDFETLRIYDLSDIEVHIVPSDIAPTGVGEPGTPPAGPALANAIAAVGRKLVTHLPMTSNGVSFS